MKASFLRGSFRAGMISFLLAGSLAAAPSAPKSTTPPKAAKPEPVEPETPQSLFTIPTNPKDGRDPFFPNSTRSAPVIATGPKTNASPVSLVVNGISTDFVILNGRTFGRGETAEVPMGNGRTRVTCVEIKLDSVVVEVNGERRELRPKPLK